MDTDSTEPLWEDEDDFEALDEEEATFVRIKPKLKDRPRRNPAEVAEASGPEVGNFETTYKPSRHEAGWLLSSLGTFYEQQLIQDVLFLVKGGKEANVYCCAAGPGYGGKDELVAAKVYRPRQFRNLRNDHMYRQGRAVLTGEGRPVKPSDQRIMRALGKKTEFGAQVQHTSWLMYEYTTLEQLHQSGAAVPEPIAAGENAVLMGYIGNRQGAAPTLSETSLDRDEATNLFRQTRRTIEAMLAAGFAHGDLSAYNILYWEGHITVIDFPQVTDIRNNPNAHFILHRDITRVCDYFARLGVPCNPDALTRDLWHRYVEAQDRTIPALS